MVLGAVITDGVIVQRLTDCVWVGLDSVMNESRIMHAARIFHALRTTHQRLHDYYKNLQPTSIPLVKTRFFPSITAYQYLDNIIQFEYLGFLENDPSCTAIHAQTLTEPVRNIVIKFVERYGERAHRTLEAEGLAPELLYCGSPQLQKDQPSYRPVTMVVMDYVVGLTLAAEKKRKGGLDAKVEDIVCREVRRALDLLHTTNLVFGDLRPPNIMITNTKEVKLIDFDWAGDLGQAQYPCLISPNVPWPADVKALDLITVAHDHDMFRRLFI